MNSVEDQKKGNARLRKQRQRKNQTESQMETKRLENVLRKRKRNANMSISEREIFLNNDANRKKIKRENETVLEHEDRLQKSYEKMREKRKDQNLNNDWPQPISPDIKRKCLSNFVKLMSKEALNENTCCVCNRTDFANGFIHRKFKEINGLELLKCSEEFLNMYMDNSEKLFKNDNNFERKLSDMKSSKLLFYIKIKFIIFFLRYCMKIFNESIYNLYEM